jgi:hypothetical protein
MYDFYMWLHYAAVYYTGYWCHVFPEGRTVQTGHVGGRMGKNEAQIGTLKWGVGKMVRHLSYHIMSSCIACSSNCTLHVLCVECGTMRTR